MKYRTVREDSPQLADLHVKQNGRRPMYTDLELGVGTIDNTLKGVRCRAAQDIRNAEGKIACSTSGTIVFELVGRDSHLVNVYWDQGLDTFVSPQDIVVTESKLVWH